MLFRGTVIKEEHRLILFNIVPEHKNSFLNDFHIKTNTENQCLPRKIFLDVLLFTLKNVAMAYNKENTQLTPYFGNRIKPLHSLLDITLGTRTTGRCMS